MDAVTAAARQMLDESCADLRIAVNGLDPALLAREPAPETNSMATLVRHAASSTRYLLGGAATGRADRQRYREGERAAAFAGGQASADQLIGLIDALEEDGRRLIRETPADRLGELLVIDGATDQSATRAWALMHALEHLREHVGHAQLTGQVLSAAS